MNRTFLFITAIAAGLLVFPSAIAGQAAAAAPVTAADASPFVGDWTLQLQGPNGPGAFELTVKAEQEKVTAEIAGETTPPQPITDITRAGESLVLNYTFNYEGNPVDAAVRLTPAPESKMNAQIDFAGGAYVMTGTATRKDKAK